MPDDLTPDEITDRIAEEIAAAIPAHYSRDFRRRLVTLYTRQALGLEKAPGRISLNRLAQNLDIERHTISTISSTALAKAWREYQERYPHLL